MRALSFALSLCCIAPAQDLLTPESLQRLARVGDPRPSPDGARLLYTVRTTDLEANKSTAQLWLLDLAAGEHRQLTTTASNWNGCWSADGKQIAFLSTRSGMPQAWVISVDGGEARQLTKHDVGIANLAWSPDGVHVSFTAAVRVAPERPALLEGLPKADARIYEELMVRHWDEWRDGTASHLFVARVDGRAPARDLMAGEAFDTPLKPFGGGEQIAWSPDGKQLCYTAKKVAGAAAAASTDSDLYIVSVDGGDARNVTDGMEGYEIDPCWSPDGRWLAFLSMERAGFESDRNRILLLDLGTGEMRELTRGFDQSAHGLVWAPDSLSLYFTSETRGTTQVYRVAIDNQPPRPISSGRWQFDGPVPAPDGKRVYATRQQTERPPEVVALSVEGASEGEPLTHVNDAALAQLRLPKVEERWFEATDGERIHAWVVYPPDFDATRKWPMLLYCQGGPQSMVGQWFSTRWNFHLMAARGYVVLGVNRRGLPGFGQKWNDDISRDWGGQSMQDLLTATDAMFEEPFIDRERTAAVGASFGGYTIYWLMGHDEENRFCAMIAHCGVFHLESMYLSTEELFFVNWDLGGPFWESPEVARDYERFSPHRFLGQWDTPLLVIHGAKDYRVPLEQGLQAFTAAQVRGVPSRFLYFPEEGHWISQPQNAVLWQRVFFDWLDRWCKKQ